VDEANTSAPVISHRYIHCSAVAPQLKDNTFEIRPATPQTLITSQVGKRTSPASNAAAYYLAESI
jgi:hypothetical protein